jgi:hypothetical protein
MCRRAANESTSDVLPEPGLLDLPHHVLDAVVQRAVDAGAGRASTALLHSRRGLRRSVLQTAQVITWCPCAGPLSHRELQAMVSRAKPVHLVVRGPRVAAAVPVALQPLAEGPVSRRAVQRLDVCISPRVCAAASVAWLMLLCISHRVHCH